MWYLENIQKLFRYTDFVMEKLAAAVLTGEVFAIITTSTTDEGVGDTMGIDVAVIVTARA